MEIKTKFNIGDIFWAIVENKPNKLKVYNINVFTTTSWFRDTSIHIYYKVVVNEKLYKDTIKESSCFKTKEDLIKSL